MKVIWNKKTKMIQFFYAFGYRLTQGICKIWKFQEIVNKEKKKISMFSRSRTAVKIFEMEKIQKARVRQ